MDKEYKLLNSSGYTCDCNVKIDHSVINSPSSTRFVPVDSKQKIKWHGSTCYAGWLSVSQVEEVKPKRVKGDNYNSDIPGRFNPSEEAAKQVGGNHYQKAIQPIDYILKNKLGYCEGNVIKYVTRHADKNGAEDIEKAIQYLEFILKDTYGINTNTTKG